MNVVAIGITVIIVAPIVFGLLGYVIALGQRMKEAESRIERLSQCLADDKVINDIRMDNLSLIVLNHIKDKGEEK